MLEISLDNDTLFLYNRVNRLEEDLRVDEKVEFWDLVRKCQNEFNCIDAGVLFGVFAGKSYKMIADELNISPRTIYNRRKRIQRIIEKKINNDS